MHAATDPLDSSPLVIQPVSMMLHEIQAPRASAATHSHVKDSEDVNEQHFAFEDSLSEVSTTEVSTTEVSETNLDPSAESLGPEDQAWLEWTLLTIRDFTIQNFTHALTAPLPSTPEGIEAKIAMFSEKIEYVTSHLRTLVNQSMRADNTLEMLYFFEIALLIVLHDWPIEYLGEDTEREATSLNMMDDWRVQARYRTVLEAREDVRQIPRIIMAEGHIWDGLGGFDQTLRRLNFQ